MNHICRKWQLLLGNCAILNVYVMHYAWYTAVIKKCHFCLWRQIPVIVSVNTPPISVLPTKIAVSDSAFNKQGFPKRLIGSCLNENDFDCNCISIEFPQKLLEKSSIPAGWNRQLTFACISLIYSMHFFHRKCVWGLSVAEQVRHSSCNSLAPVTVSNQWAILNFQTP